MNLKTLLTNRETFNRKRDDYIVDEVLSIENFIQPNTVSVFAKCLRDKAIGDLLLILDKFANADIISIYSNNKFFSVTPYNSTPIYQVTPLIDDILISKGDIVILQISPSNYGTHSSNTDLTTSSTLLGFNNFCSSSPYTASSISSHNVTLTTSLTAPAGTLLFFVTSLSFPEDINAKIYPAILSADASGTAITIDKVLPPSVTSGILFVANQNLNFVKGSTNSIHGSSNTILGDSNTITGNNHNVIGKTNFISNSNNYAIGELNNLSNTYGFALGYANTLPKINGLSLGTHNIVNNDNAVVIGNYGIALNVNSMILACGAFQAAGDQQNEIIVAGGAGTFDLPMIIRGNAISTLTINATSSNGDGSTVSFGVRRMTFKNIAGTVTQIGTTQTIGTDIGTVPTITISSPANHTVNINFAPSNRGMLKVDVVTMGSLQ